MKNIFVLFLILCASPVLADGAFVASPCQAFGTTSGTCLQGAGALGSPSSVGTLPAYTLGGTIAGGGNQINNVIIGTSTPLAGSFTTVSATSVTSPLQIGGSAASSTLTLESTSGVGTTDAILLKTASQVDRMQIITGGQVNIGPNVTAATPALFTINSNTVASLAGVSNTVLQMNGADGAFSNVLLDSYGTGVMGTFAFRSGRGLGSAFTASQSGDDFGLLSFVGASSANTFANIGLGAGGAGVAANATENWSATNQGTRLKFFVTANTTAAISLAMILQNSGGLTVGGTTDPGAGGLQVNAQTFMPNITTSSAAQTGTVCWTTGTGKFTVDTTVGCLTSLTAAKNITGKLSPTQALALVSKLEPFAFRYKPGWGDGGHYEQFGFGAEQVAQVDERMVGRDPEGNLQGVRYQELTAVLAGAIQELKADNDNLRVCQTSWKCRIFGIK